jgi:cobalamin biosynthesis protein CobD/CbiB
MSFDNSNAELGIAITQARAAQNQLDQAKGFERQHDWSIGYLEERILGMFVALLVVILVSVWAFDVPSLVRYTVTILSGAVLVYGRSMATQRKKDMDALRQQQVRDHSRKAYLRINQRD